jgi:F0F1-type ATP synthase epsilon subunit
VLRANVRDGEKSTMRLELACGEGFLQALPDKITVLTDAALSADEIEVSEARAELAAATEEQKNAGGDLAAWKRAQSKIEFANAKLKVVGVGA